MSADNGGHAAARRAGPGGATLPADQLRQLVREVLADVIASMPAQPESHAVPAAPPSSVPRADPDAGTPPDTSRGTAALGTTPSHRAPRIQDHLGLAVSGERDDPASWTVRIGTDDELHAFVLRVLKLAGNPKLRGDLISGRARFRLAAPSAAAPAAAHRVEKGAVTERVVAAAAAAGARLVLGPRAVLTPLAKDKARALGVPIDRERRALSGTERAPKEHL
jgi:hypothetical protein